MKHILFILLFLPIMASAQTKADYEQIIGKFVTVYNDKQPEQICKLFSYKWGPNFNCMWDKHFTDTYNEYGKIISCKYMGKVSSDPGIIAFKVVFEKKGTKAMSLSLEEDKKFGTFRFDTSSDEIQAMLSRAK